MLCTIFILFISSISLYLDSNSESETISVNKRENTDFDFISFNLNNCHDHPPCESPDSTTNITLLV